MENIFDYLVQFAWKHKQIGLLVQVKGQDLRELRYEAFTENFNSKNFRFLHSRTEDNLKKPETSVSSINLLYLVALLGDKTIFNLLIEEYNFDGEEWDPTLKIYTKAYGEDEFKVDLHLSGMTPRQLLERF